MADLYPLQVIGFVFSLFMLFFTYYTYKRKDFSAGDAALWAVVWLWFLAATAFSPFIDQVLVPLKLLSLFDLILVSASGILLVVVVMLNKRLSVMEGKLDVVVRKVAMEEAGIGTGNKAKKKR